MYLDQFVTMLKVLKPSHPSQEITSVCLSVATRDVPTKDERCLTLAGPSPHLDFVLETIIGLPRLGKWKCSHECDKTASYNETQRFCNDNSWPPTGVPNTGAERFKQFFASIEEVNRNINIKGAVIEMGFWRGGSMMVTATCQATS